MIVKRTGKHPNGYPDFYNLYLRWMALAEKSGSNHHIQEAYRFARLAEEFGLAIIEDEITFVDF